ncbi:MAG: prevent-host-death family protein [Thiohalocapsa sp.]
MKNYNLDSLQEHTADSTREAQAGRISVVTNEDGPLLLAVPLDELLLKYGVNIDLAVKLFDAETLSLGNAVKLAGMPLTRLHGSSQACRSSDCSSSTR